jgi:hypothetical protein
VAIQFSATYVPLCTVDTEYQPDLSGPAVSEPHYGHFLYRRLLANEPPVGEYALYVCQRKRDSRVTGASERVAALLGAAAASIIEELLVSRYNPGAASDGAGLRRSSIPLW